MFQGCGSELAKSIIIYRQGRLNGIKILLRKTED